MVAVIRAPAEAASSLVALAITITNKAFVLETDQNGNLLQEPIEVTLPALDSSASLEHTFFSLSFDVDGNVVIAMGHDNIDISSEVVVVNLI